MAVPVLYVRPGCPLCDEAVQCLWDIALRQVDIETDPLLEHEYGERIPVLARPDGGELNWPFAREEARAFLGAR